MPDKQEDIVAPVFQEEAHVGTVPVRTGAVRVSKSRELHKELIERSFVKATRKFNA